MIVELPLKNLKLLLKIAIFFALIVAGYSAVNNASKVQAACMFGCCSGCDPECTTWRTITPCSTQCFNRNTCSDGSRTCGSCPSQPPPPVQNCTPNATRCNGCDQVTCLGDGSGEYVSGPGACCGPPPPPPPPPCTATNPTAVNLNSPADNATVSTNNVTLSWAATTNWGTNCTGSHQYNVYLSLNCVVGGYVLQSSVGDTITSLNVPSLTWGARYCWYVQAHNGSNYANSATRSFTINRPPDVGSHSFTQPNSCTLSSGISGRPVNPLDITSTQESENPISYSFTFTDPDDANPDYTDSYLVFVPATGTHAVTADVVTSNVLLQQASHVDVKSVGVRINKRNSLITVYSLANGSAWNGGASTGDRLNTYGTGTVMGIGSDSTMIVSGASVTANFKIRMESLLTSGLYNVYGMVVQNVGGVSVSSYADSTGALMYKKLDSWTFDMQNPGSTLTGPTYNADRTFNVVWGVSDNMAVGDVRSYIWADQAGAVLDDQTIPTTINLGTNSLSYHYDGDLARHDPSNAGITPSGLGPHKYKTAGVNAGYTYKIVTRDTACNISETTTGVSEPDPWLMSYKGNISAQQGYIVTIPSYSTFRPPFNLSDVGTPNLSTYGVIAGDSKVPTQRISKAATYSLNYTNDAVSPPVNTGFSRWYDLVLDRVTKNGTNVVTPPVGVVVVATDFSSFMGVPRGSKVAYNVQGNMLIGPGQLCDVQGIILVNGDLTISTDFINNRTDVYACMFVVSGSVTVVNAPLKTPVVPTSSSQPPNYDILAGYFLVEGSFIVNTNNVSRNFADTNKYQGLYIDGGLYAGTTVLNRDLNYIANQNDPGIDIFYNPVYRMTFAGDLGRREYSFREIL